MDIYNIKDTYIEFIRAYDNRVADNKMNHVHILASYY